MTLPIELDLTMVKTHIHVENEVNRSNGSKVIEVTDRRTDGRTDGRTNGRTDATDCSISLANAVDN